MLLLLITTKLLTTELLAPTKALPMLRGSISKDPRIYWRKPDKGSQNFGYFQNWPYLEDTGLRTLITIKKRGGLSNSLCREKTCGTFNISNWEGDKEALEMLKCVKKNRPIG